jgi:hypothetical protein
LKDTGFYKIEVKELVLNKGICKVPLIYFKNEHGLKQGYCHISQKTLFLTGYE